MCCKWHDSIVQSLLNNIACIDSCDLTGTSPDFNSCENYGGSPLYLGYEKRQDSKVHILLKNGAYLNQCENSGSSPLFIAI